MLCFQYLRDPLFLACLVVYFLNRWIFKSLGTGGFFHNHLNDLICIPFWVPIMLWGQRRLGLREGDGPPLCSEILIPLFLWSWYFEFVLPQSGLVGERAVADYQDVLFYSLGSAIAGLFWRWWYRGPVKDLAAEMHSFPRSSAMPYPQLGSSSTPVDPARSTGRSDFSRTDESQARSRPTEVGPTGKPGSRADLGNG